MQKTTLIVDDSTTMRRMVSDTLTSAGFAVVEGQNGQDALRKIGDRKIDLVITDFNMPVMGGIAFVRELRARPDFRRTPILMLTTEFEEARKKEGRAAGATGWIVKPFDPTQLLQVIARLVA